MQASPATAGSIAIAPKEPGRRPSGRRHYSRATVLVRLAEWLDAQTVADGAVHIPTGEDRSPWHLDDSENSLHLARACRGVLSSASTHPRCAPGAAALARAIHFAPSSATRLRLALAAIDLMPRPIRATTANKAGNMNRPTNAAGPPPPITIRATASTASPRSAAATTGDRSRRAVRPIRSASTSPKI